MALRINTGEIVIDMCCCVFWFCLVEILSLSGFFICLIEIVGHLLSSQEEIINFHDIILFKNR